MGTETEKKRRLLREIQSDTIRPEQVLDSRPKRVPTSEDEEEEQDKSTLKVLTS